jgi:hypothetical protein
MRRLPVIALVGLLVAGCSSSSDTSSIDERTCEIARDIGANADVQTYAETRDRVKDLYDGYGQAASPAIRSGLRDMLEGLTNLDADLVGQGAEEVNDACTALGY